ncbi:MAG: hypothetical protein O2958_00565 [Gemmatimonadetes bacterium]|nr:hypothetical protein [Gemmatimonadota bacterium]MDA1102709.1 hypothetical protein [Gemmatimonadota bacterium]
MIPDHDFNTTDRRHRERRIWRNGLLISAIIHLLLFFAWRGNVIPLSPFAAAGPQAGDNRAAAGSLQALNVRTPPPVPIVPPPVPIAVEVAVEPVDFEQEVEYDPASVLGEEPGLLEGPGLADGPGEGDGGNAAEGLFRLEPASPHGLIIPPSNSSLRNTEVQVWVFVDERGRVVSDSTRLAPPTRDGGYNRRLIREASEWVFRPATQDGKAIASWFAYKLSM